MRPLVLGFLGVSGVALTFLVATAEGRIDRGADLRVVWGPEPKSLDPCIVTGSIESRYLYSFLEGLITYDREDPDKPIPGMCEKMPDVSSDGLTYTFKIRKSGWSNGDPVRSTDFEFAWKRCLDAEIECEYVTMLYYLKNAKRYGASRLAEVALRELERPTSKSESELETLAAETVGPGAHRGHLGRLDSLLSSGRVSGRLKLVLRKARAEAAAREPVSWSDVGVRCPDERTLVVTLEDPTPFILDIFGFMTLMPVHPPSVVARGENWIKPPGVVSNGPFLVEDWRPHYGIVFARNPHYWDAENVKVRKFVAYAVENQATAFNYYERGMVDWLDRNAIPPAFIESLLRRSDFHSFASFTSYFLRFNVTRPPFDDPRVRRAFSMCVLPEEVCAALRAGQIPTRRLVPPYAGYEGIQPRGVSYDPTAAKRLFHEALAGKSPESLGVVEFLGSTRPEVRDIFMVLQAQFSRALGVKIQPKLVEWQSYLDKMSGLDYSIAYGGWIGDYYDPNTFIDMWITGGGNNRSGWGSREYDDWVKEAAGLRDVSRRLGVFRRCEKMLLEDECVLAPLFYPPNSYMAKPGLKGLKHSLMDRYLPRYLEPAP